MTTLGAALAASAVLIAIAFLLYVFFRRIFLGSSAKRAARRLRHQWPTLQWHDDLVATDCSGRLKILVREERVNGPASLRIFVDDLATPVSIYIEVVSPLVRWLRKNLLRVNLLSTGDSFLDSKLAIVLADPELSARDETEKAMQSQEARQALRALVTLEIREVALRDGVAVTTNALPATPSDEWANQLLSNLGVLSKAAGG